MTAEPLTVDVDVVTDAAGSPIRNARLAVRNVVQLNCGCRRFECDRPGGGDVHVLRGEHCESKNLTDHQRQVLDFERHWADRARRDGSKEAAIVEVFGLNTTAYYQALNRLLDCPAAVVFDAQLVYRLRRIRDARMARISVGVPPS